MSLALAFLLAACSGAPAAEPWPAGAPEYRIDVVGQGHLDAVWLWAWPEALSEVHSTFRSILDRMKETPEFTFTAADVVFYEWVAQNDPAMLAEIRKRVEEGRWDLAGGWWVEADTPGPCGESLVRQGLYGQLTLRRLFGRGTTVANNPDAAGHPNTLPQILKMQGMDNFVFTRPGPHEKTLPTGLFWWEGLDGTRILAYRPPLGYGLSQLIASHIRNLITKRNPTTKSLLVFFGAGDHGGGPTKANIRSIAELRSQTGAPTVQYATPGRYFAAIKQQADLSLPLVRDELLHHAAGGYTNVSEFKKSNRAAETELLTAEKLAAIGSVAWGVEYPKADFTSAWKKVLFLHMHDSMNGVSLPDHYATTARDSHGYALDVARTALYKAAQRLAWQVPAEDPASKYLVVVNPHPWDVNAVVQYELYHSANAPTRLEDERGNAIPHQWIAGTTHIQSRNILVARVPVPAFGYRQVRVRQDAKAAKPESAVRADGKVLENEHLRVTFQPSGAIGIFDKDAGMEVFQAAGARAVVLDDPHDTWADINTFDSDIGAFENATTRVLENGPLRSVVRVLTRYGNSTLTVDWMLYAGSRSLEGRVALDWHEQRKMLKFSYPLAVGSPQATYETPYGHMLREPNGHEEPGLRWVDVTGTHNGSQCGLAVINDAKYGYSAKGSDLRVSVVRSPLYGHGSNRKVDLSQEHLWQNQGVQTFRVLLVPHQGGWQDAGIVRMAEEFVTPVPVIYQGIHPGTRPESGSFLSIDAPNVMVSAIKQAEEPTSRGDLVFRCYETAGRPAKATLDLRFAKQRWSGSFRPSEIKTLRVNLQSGDIREVNALEE